MNVVFNPQTVNVSVDPTTMGITFSTPVAREEAYTGSYTVTPSSETQTLQTNGKRMTGDITVNPIPSNYGLITWNGAVLTVS